MLLDKQAMFSEAQSVAGTNATTVSTNSYDLGAAQTLPSAGGGTVPSDVGKASPPIFAEVTTAASGGTSVEAQLIMSANADLSSPTVLQSSGAIAVASLVQGYQFRLGGSVPPGVSARYLGMRFITVGAVATIAVTAGIAKNKQTNPFVG